MVVDNGQSAPTSGTLLYWGLWSLSFVALIGAWVGLNKLKTNIWVRVFGRLTFILALFTFVPPFSFVPNPLGMLWSITGGYSYDLRLPFINKFVVLGDPTERLKPRLDGIIGQTGLDPLDPQHPLRSYELVRVRVPNRAPGSIADYVIVEVRMVYADGSERIHSLPIRQYGGLYLLYMRFDNSDLYNDLNRLYAQHLELPLTPFVDENTPTSLHTPERHTEAKLPSAFAEYESIYNWAHIYGGSDDEPLTQQLTMSPNGKGLLVSYYGNYPGAPLWLLKLDGGQPVKVAEHVSDYAWSPDGRYIVYTLDESDARPVPNFPLYVVRSDGGNSVRLVDYGKAKLAGVAQDGLWHVKDDAVWVAPYDAGPARQISQVANAMDVRVYPSHDGSRFAYHCQGELCLQKVGETTSIKVRIPGFRSPQSYDALLTQVAWKQNDSQVAIVVHEIASPSSYWDYRDARLLLLDLSGRILHDSPIAPAGAAGTPQWTHDGRYIFVQTTPYGGRRIVAVETETGKAWDLTGPRWDPWFTLAPDGKYLLMHNGRGGFWRSEINYKTNP